MTKLRKIILIPALSIVSISGFFSCGVDRWPEYAHMTALDTWMYDIMQQNYLWYQDLPSYDDANLFLEPAQFLSKVKSKKTVIRSSILSWRLRCLPMDSTIH